MKSRFLRAVLGLIGLMASAIYMVTPASAQVSGVSVDFAAAEPTTFDHSTGGGAWNDGTVNKDIERSLEGESFVCGDHVSYLTKISVGNTSDLSTLGDMTMEFTYHFTLDSTGQSGVALTDPFIATATTSDSSNSFTGPSVVTTTSSEVIGTIFTKGSELIKKVSVSGLSAGEVFVLRTDVVIACQPGSRPTGNLQAKLDAGFVIAKNGGTPISPAESLGIGTKTVDLKNVGRVGGPILKIEKTVTLPSSSCPGVEYISIEPNDEVKYCYVVSNPSNVGRKGAPLYNVSQILDDHGPYPDFTVSLSGLTDIDGDGQADDLAAGAFAYGTKTLAFDGDKDTLVTNIATITADDRPIDPIQLTASDTAQVFIDAPDPSPAISLTKVTNGSDGSTILVGTPITWTYTITNTGGVDLTNIALSDDKLGTVTCTSTTLAVSASLICTATGTAIANNYENTATVTASYGTQTVSASDSSSYFGADPKIDISKSPDSQVVVEGENANFTIKVKNIGNVALTTVVITDPLASGCENSFSTLAVSEEVTYTCAIGPITAPFTNVATVHAKYGTTDITDNDDAIVTVDYLPKISVTKTANPTSVPETGGSATFTVAVKNIGVENFKLTSLVDDKFGDLAGSGSCSVPQTIAAGETYTCTFTKTLSSDLRIPHINTVTATGEDPEKHQTSASDDATVTFTDVLPDISLTKTANPTAVRFTGGLVTYTLRITNVGLEKVTITSFVDNTIPLSAQCLAFKGQILNPGAYFECQVPNVPIYGPAGGSVTNTATAVGQDNEGNSDSASASAVVKLWWFGRTPGFWKNHPEVWGGTYSPSTYVQDVFNVPSALLNSGSLILDLDKNGKKDQLIDALGYKGGSTLSGGAQILLRAAVAALLNEVYYGADYPGATSVNDLKTQVNDVLGLQDRNQYINLGSYFDYWNNGVEAPLP